MGRGPPEFFTHGIECISIEKLMISGFNGSFNPGSPNSKRIHIQDSSILK